MTRDSKVTKQHKFTFLYVKAHIFIPLFNVIYGLVIVEIKVEGDDNVIELA